MSYRGEFFWWKVSLRSKRFLFRFLTARELGRAQKGLRSPQFSRGQKSEKVFVCSSYARKRLLRRLVESLKSYLYILGISISFASIVKIIMLLLKRPVKRHFTTNSVTAIKKTKYKQVKIFNTSSSKE